MTLASFWGRSFTPIFQWRNATLSCRVNGFSHDRCRHEAIVSGILAGLALAGFNLQAQRSGINFLPVKIGPRFGEEAGHWKNRPRQSQKKTGCLIHLLGGSW